MALTQWRRDEMVTDEQLLMVERFGPLSLLMLHETPLSPAWNLNFLANFFTGPIYRELAERFDLSRPEFVILYTLKHAKGLVARDICLATGLPKNSISRSVSELLSRGLIARDVDADDKRAKPLMLTDGGAEMLDRVEPLFLSRQAAMRNALTLAEKTEFDRLLDKMICAMPNWVEAE